MKKLIIFDLDGTLVNSLQDLAEAVNYALRECGYREYEISEFNMMIGHGIKNLLLTALPEKKRSEEEFKRLAPLFFDHYDRNITRHTTPYSGIRELLSALHKLGYKMAIASNKYQAGTEKIAKDIFAEIPFDAVYGQREGVATKPDPQIVYDILSELGLEASDAIYVGDSAVDIQTAKSASVVNVGVSWGLRSVEELEEAGADYIISKADELLEIIAKL